MNIGNQRRVIVVSELETPIPTEHAKEDTARADAPEPTREEPRRVPATS
jgi:hypothetical protein